MSEKSQKINFCVHYYTGGSDNSGSDDMGMDSLEAGGRLLVILKFVKTPRVNCLAMSKLVTYKNRNILWELDFINKHDVI